MPRREVALITGCSSGFGEAIALGFVRQGYTVVATMRDLDRAPEAVAEACDLLTLDVTDIDSRSRCVRSVLDRYGTIDVLVHNAGIAYFGPLEETPEDVSRAVMETNYFGPLELTRAVLPRMRAQGSGRVVFVTAIGALLCSPILGAYCASKHAVDAAVAALDVEVRPFGIRTASVLPAQFRTELMAKAPAASVSEVYRSIVDRLMSGFAERTAAAPTDLSPVVDAVIEAATAEAPRIRTVVGGGGARMLDRLIPELELIKASEDERAGYAP